MSETPNAAVDAARPEGRGAFLVLDGPDGGGKTTQAKLTVESLRACGHTVVHLREPGGTTIGERIREILLDRASAAMCAETETLLYLAARMQLLREIILPSLDRGEIVVCERYIYSTVAYQGAHGKLSMDDIWRLWDAIARESNEPRIQPDRVLFLDVDPDLGLGRLAGEKDRMEAMGADFHRRVYENYGAIAERLGSLVTRVDATRDVASVQASIRSELHDLGLIRAAEDPA